MKTKEKKKRRAQHLIVFQRLLVHALMNLLNLPSHQLSLGSSHSVNRTSSGLWDSDNANANANANETVPTSQKSALAGLSLVLKNSFWAKIQKPNFYFLLEGLSTPVC